MATLPGGDLARIRRDLARELGEVAWTKADVNDALQAIEDWWDLPATKAALSAAIDAATAFTFSNPQKRVIGKLWLRSKFERGN